MKNRISFTLSVISPTTYDTHHSWYLSRVFSVFLTSGESKASRWNACRHPRSFLVIVAIIVTIGNMIGLVTTFASIIAIHAVGLSLRAWKKIIRVTPRSSTVRETFFASNWQSDAFMHEWFPRWRAYPQKFCEPREIGLRNEPRFVALHRSRTVLLPNRRKIGWKRNGEKVRKTRRFELLWKWNSGFWDLAAVIF